MKARPGTLPAAVHWRRAWSPWTLAALLAGLLAGGCLGAWRVLGAHAEASRLEARLETLRRMAREAEDLLPVVEAFERSGGSEKAELALQALRELLPAGLDPVEIHSRVRLLAPRAGLRLLALDVLEPVPLQLDGCGDPVAQVECSIRAQGPFDAFLRLLRLVQDFQGPVALLDCGLTVQADGSFEVLASLGFLGRLPESPEAATLLPAGQP